MSTRRKVGTALVALAVLVFFLGGWTRALVEHPSLLMATAPLLILGIVLFATGDRKVQLR